MLLQQLGNNFVLRLQFCLQLLDLTSSCRVLPLRVSSILFAFEADFGIFEQHPLPIVEVDRANLVLVAKRRHGHLLNQVLSDNRYFLRSGQIRSLGHLAFPFLGPLNSSTLLATRFRSQQNSRIRDLANVILESPNEVFICDAQTLQFIEVNHGAVEASGYSAEELLCMSPLDLNPEFDRESIDRLLAELRIGRKHTLEFPSHHRRKTGETYPVQISLHRSSYNDVPVFVAFVTDLTSIRQLEGKLALARKLESVGQLAAGIAHEINTPLQCISGNIEYLTNCSGRLFNVLDCYQNLLEDDTAPTNWEARCREMQEILNSCRFASMREQVPAAIEESREAVCRTVKIVRAMRDFSHPGTKSMQPANLNRLIESSIAISSNRWKQAAEVDLKLNDDLPEIPMFASEMNQVLLNLIVNAGDAIADRFPPDSGERGTITITTDFDESWVYLTVADTGCGIPESIRDKLFDPFFTTKDVGKGTGQGLSLARGVVVNEHHGHLDLESEVGVGSKFIAKLPRFQSDTDSPMQLASQCVQ
jgi:two-component system, NtrC family, sensor kinase